MAGRGHAGGILALLELIEEHRGAVEYDFRSRFHLGAHEIGNDVGWGEAIRLVRILRSDPSSMLAAAVEDWDYPLSREAAILADVWDLEYAKAGAKKAERYPRPFKQKASSTRTWGDAGGRSRDEVIAILRAHGRELVS